MNNKETIQQLIIDRKILPLYYHQSETVSIAVLKALYDAGIRAVEYTNRGVHALDNFMAMRKVVDEDLHGMRLGIGTIKSVSDAEQFIAAGADFIISPVVNPDVAAIAHKANVLWIPGCMTPTEIDLAERNNASLIKIFPGNVLQPAYVSAIKELFPNLRFMVTGGVEANEENLRAWYNAGVTTVGLGSKLISKSILEQGDYTKITTTTISILQIIETISKEV